MKYIPSIAFEEMSGSAKGVTAAKTRGRKYIRNRGYGGSVRTSDQASVKAVFKRLSQAWQSLTNAQILAWNAAAGRAEAKSVLGTKTKITGSNLFMRLNYWVVYCGGQIMQNPPALAGVDAPAPTLEEAATISSPGQWPLHSENPLRRSKNLRRFSYNIRRIGKESLYLQNVRP